MTLYLIVRIYVRSIVVYKSQLMCNNGLVTSHLIVCRTEKCSSKGCFYHLCCSLVNQAQSWHFIIETALVVNILRLASTG